jgi:hypothetical protein
MKDDVIIKGGKKMRKIIGDLFNNIRAKKKFDDLEIVPLYEEKVETKTYLLKDEKSGVELPITILEYEARNPKTNKVYKQLDIASPQVWEAPPLLYSIQSTFTPLHSFVAVGRKGKSVVNEAFDEYIKEVKESGFGRGNDERVKKVLKKVFGDIEEINDLQSLP